MLTKNLLVLKKTIYGFAFGWTVLIAFLCLAKLNDLPSFGDSLMDKYVHFTFHFVFIALWGIYSWFKQNEIVLSKIVNVTIISLVYGILIELMQEYLTTTRHADVFDVVANFLGAATASLVFVIIKKLMSKTK